MKGIRCVLWGMVMIGLFGASSVFAAKKGNAEYYLADLPTYLNEEVDLDVGSVYISRYDFEGPEGFQRLTAYTSDGITNSYIDIYCPIEDTKKLLRRYGTKSEYEQYGTNYSHRLKTRSLKGILKKLGSEYVVFTELPASMSGEENDEDADSEEEDETSSRYAPRIWTSKDGMTFRGSFKGFDGTLVEVRRSDTMQLIRFPISVLSVDDQKWVKGE